jgi:hypothetical protein
MWQLLDQLNCVSESKSSYLTTDGQPSSLSWCQATIRASDRFFFLLEIFFRQLRVCYFVASSLTKGRLLLLLGLDRVVPLGSESLGTQDHILLSQFWRLPQPGVNCMVSQRSEKNYDSIIDLFLLFRIRPR